MLGSCSEPTKLIGAPSVARGEDLLELGSDPDALTDMGETPLTLAQCRTEKGHAAPNMAQPESGNHTEVANICAVAQIYELVTLIDHCS